jgi:hypothetical protein
MDTGSTSQPYYTDRTCLLYGLQGRTFIGAAALGTDERALDKSLEELVASLAVAQRRSTSLQTMGAWSDDKEERKLRWAMQGVPLCRIVPTLYSCTVAAASGAESPEFVETESGEWCPSLDSAVVTLTPTDSGCEGAIWELLEKHRRLVLKPTQGSNSAGVILLSLDPDPLCTPQSSGAPRVAQSCSPLPTGSVWAYAPNKNECILAEMVSRHERHEWFARCVSARPLLCGKSCRMMVEPAVAHEQELCVLAINGGMLQLLAGRCNCMERLLMLEGEETLVAPSDFSPPSARRFSLSEPARAAHTAMVLSQGVEGDDERRTLHEVIRSTVHTLAGASNAAAFRADFFVRWGTSASGGRAQLWLNEVEHGFGAGCMVGWWGAPLCELALRTWTLGDPVHRARLEAEIAANTAVRPTAGVGIGTGRGGYGRLDGCVSWREWMAGPGALAITLPGAA